MLRKEVPYGPPSGESMEELFCKNKKCCLTGSSYVPLRGELEGTLFNGVKLLNQKVNHPCPIHDLII